MNIKEKHIGGEKMKKKINVFKTPILELERICKENDSFIEVQRPTRDIMILRFNYEEDN